MTTWFCADAGLVAAWAELSDHDVWYGYRQGRCFPTYDAHVIPNTIISLLTVPAGYPTPNDLLSCMAAWSQAKYAAVLTDGSSGCGLAHLIQKFSESESPKGSPGPPRAYTGY